MTFLLLPGRQIVNTRYQEEYLNRILGRELAALPEMLGAAPVGKVTALVFAVTSCNRSNSRYNPLPFETRAILVYEFARRLKADFGVGFHILGIPHAPPTGSFGARVLKEVAEETVPLEDIPLSNSTRTVFRDFPDALAQIRRLFHDPLLTEQGDLTETRNYSTYTRDMAGAIDLKYQEIRPFLRPGKIVDEGCADGALLQRVARDLPDSDLLGVDLSAEMLARAHEAQRAGAFGGAFVFFKQQNLMTPVSDAQAGQADTILCNSTLHELWSYGAGDASVRAYLRGKGRQLRPGGCLVIRDVVGPDDKDQLVLLECAADDGLPTDDGVVPVAALSTLARFTRFRRDFRPGEAHPDAEAVTREGRTLSRLPLGYTMEFIAKMDYADNWLSEMHEAFCFWSFADWTREMAEAGLAVLPGSHAYVNPWRVEHSFRKRVRLYSADGAPLPFPVTNMVLAAEKPMP